MKSRREFLKHSAATGALITTPYIWTSQYARAQDLNSKPTVAAIGVGGSRGRFNQGGAIARKAAQLGTMIAVCDVDDLQYENGAVLSVHNRYQREGGIDFENGILFEGEKGRIFVNRSKLQGKVIDELSEKDHEEISKQITKLYRGRRRATTCGISLRASKIVNNRFPMFSPITAR